MRSTYPGGDLEFSPDNGETWVPIPKGIVDFSEFEPDAGPVVSYVPNRAERRKAERDARRNRLEKGSHRA